MSNDRNGVTIAVAEKFRDKNSLDERKSDRLMVVKIHMASKVIRVIATYAPQAVCSINKKDHF